MGRVVNLAVSKVRVEMHANESKVCARARVEKVHQIRWERPHITINRCAKAVNRLVCRVPIDGNLRRRVGSSQREAQKDPTEKQKTNSGIPVPGNVGHSISPSYEFQDRTHQSRSCLPAVVRRRYLIYPSI